MKELNFKEWLSSAAVIEDYDFERLAKNLPKEMHPPEEERKKMVENGLKNID